MRLPTAPAAEFLAARFPLRVHAAEAVGSSSFTVSAARCCRSAALAFGLCMTPRPSYCSAEPPTAVAVPDRPFAITRSDQGVLVTEGERKVLFYQQRTKSLQGRYRRENYVHPLYSLDGEVLTEDFPSDHLLHRGIYWAWHQLWVGEKRAGDPWAAKDFTVHVESIEVTRADQQAVALDVHAVWTSPELSDAAGQPLPIVREQTTVRVHRSSQSLRLIDFVIRLKALVPDVRIGGSEDEKGYGGFSVRVRLPQDLTFTGSGGPVEPQKNAVEAGPWINLTAADWGLAILTHPSSPDFPQRWILRQQRSMQNPVYPGRNPVVVPHDQPLVLRYRLAVHRGQLDQAAIDRLQQQYQHESP